MSVPTAISDLSATAASNSPAGSESVFPSLDDYLRAAFAFIRQLSDGKVGYDGSGNVTPLASETLGSVSLPWQNVYGVVGSFTGPLIVAGTTGGLGYGTGAGGSATQITNKTGSVHVNKACGQITMNNASLAAGAVVTFQLINSAIGQYDSLVVVLAGGAATAGTYQVSVDSVSAGQAFIQVQNISAGPLSEALLVNFAVIKGVIT